MELDIETKINQVEDLGTSDLLMELKASVENLSVLNKTTKYVVNNYFGQDQYVCQILEKELGKAEDELFKKWNLDDGIYVDDEDSALAADVIYPTLTDKFYYAKSMSEINNEETLGHCKNEIINYFNKELDKYAKNYNIEKDLIENVKKDVPDIVEKHVDKVVDKLFNDKTRDRLAKLCDNWEKAYKDLNYEKMDEISEKILSHFKKPGTVYRDNELEKKLEEVVTKNKFIQNKLARGEEGKLSEIEEKVIMKDIESEKESCVSPEAEKEMDEYRDLFIREVLLTPSEKERMEELREKLLKTEGFSKLDRVLLEDDDNQNMFEKYI